MLISKLVGIADDFSKAKELQSRVQKKRANGDSRPFEKILNEELEKMKKATKDTGK